ncbi:MAG: MotA/TolQ/ExbB proton channel family protein [Thermoguttaceae bacterium]|nr:MotA/TolQ/ExbB proton channel family protein [Thermoguttaceae bacterium]
MKKHVIGFLGSPILWGLGATFAFYFALNGGLIANETLVRYCAGHPVEYATVAMFCVGLFDLGFKLFRSVRERRALDGGLFPPKRAEKESVADVDDYLKSLDKARAVRGDSTFLRRLRDALDFLKYGGSPDDLDQELRFLADDAFDRRETEYGLVKAFIWAIPILGFLGTVLGITVALGSLDLTRLETTGDMLAAGLKVAFDTTALALGLVFVLYFLLYFSRRQDAALGADVSRLVDAELKGRFIAEESQASAASRQTELDATKRVLASVAESFEETTRRQTALWSEANAAVAQKSAELSLDAAERFATALDKALRDGCDGWAQTLAETQRRFVEESLRPALDAAARNAARLDALEEKLTRETEALGATLRACADVAALEDRLARSLEKIAEVGAFEKTLNNLSATVCLLNSKLTTTPSRAATIPLDAATTAISTPDADEKSRETARLQAEAFAALDALESDLGAANPTPSEPLVSPIADAPKSPRATLGKKRSA